MQYNQTVELCTAIRPRLYQFMTCSINISNIDKGWKTRMRENSK